MNEYVIVMDKQYIGYPLYKSKGCIMIEPYAYLSNSKIFRKLRSIIYKYNKEWTIGLNKKLIGISKTYILYDSISPVVANYIRKNNPDARIIVYYINPEKYSYKFKEYEKSDAEIWTFDESDSMKLNNRWNPLIYFGTKTAVENEKKEYDVVFVGADKGRYSQLIDIKKELNDRGISTKFYIMPSSDFPLFNKRKYSKRISYEENINLILESKVLLDIMQVNQTGYTMRIPESMVNHIKLITNNMKISEYDFYTPNNIFIIGKDSYDSLFDFVNTPWDHSKDEYIKDLEFEYWIRKFKL